MNFLIGGFLILYVILVAGFFGHVDKLTTVDFKNISEIQGESGGGESNMMIVGDAYRHLLVFIQISDLHLSIFQDSTRIEAFKEFCNGTINVIKPAVVIASGDLTDGKYDDGISTNEFEEEWKRYRHAIDSFGVLNKTMWLDMRGNHDNFNVPLHAYSSYYSKYAVQASQSGHNGSYMYSIVPKMERFSSLPSERYSFVAVDAALHPGPRAPWNFFGKLEDSEFNMLERFEEQTRNSNGTVWFGHYPTSFILGGPLRYLMRHATAYMCGHLHTAFGLVDHMYTNHPSGLLELELADFKITRRYRVAAFDHGSFAFTDVEHNTWPVILVTNPKHVLFSGKRDESLARNSTHIRLLVFSPSKLQDVKVQLDKGKWLDAKHIQGPLYVVEWEPQLYQDGIHELIATAWDENGRKASVVQSFSLDGTKGSWNFSFLGRLALMIDALVLPYTLYLLASVGSVLPIIGIRIIHRCVKTREVSLRKITSALGRFMTPLIRRIWITSTINRMFIPLILGPLYFPLGPWYMGQMLDEKEGYGIGFAWGTLIDGQYLPPAFGYIFDGVIQLFWFHIPFVIVLSYCVDRKFRILSWNENLSRIWNHVPFLLFFIIRFVVGKLVHLYTGLAILLFGELQKYSIAYGIVMWFFMVSLRKCHFAEAEKVWGTKDPNRRQTVLLPGQEERILTRTPNSDEMDSDGHES